MAIYADMNGYPGPKHVLEMVDQLDLSDQQVNDIQAIFDEMSESARAKGKAIIAREQQLDDLFQSGKADQETVERLSRDIGTMRGELRAIHLVAHLSAAQVLSAEQTEKYNALRHGSHDPDMHH
jgi:Spy/CpxP family protein refolding chaperone